MGGQTGSTQQGRQQQGAAPPQRPQGAFSQANGQHFQPGGNTGQRSSTAPQQQGGFGAQFGPPRGPVNNHMMGQALAEQNNPMSQHYSPAQQPQQPQQFQQPQPMRQNMSSQMPQWMRDQNAQTAKPLDPTKTFPASQQAPQPGAFGPPQQPQQQQPGAFVPQRQQVTPPPAPQQAAMPQDDLSGKFGGGGKYDRRELTRDEAKMRRRARKTGNRKQWRQYKKNNWGGQ